MTCTLLGALHVPSIIRAAFLKCKLEDTRKQFHKQQQTFLSTWNIYAHFHNPGEKVEQNGRIEIKRYLQNEV